MRILIVSMLVLLPLLGGGALRAAHAAGVDVQAAEAASADDGHAPSASADAAEAPESWQHIAARMLAGGVLVLLLLVAGAYFFENRLVFRPSRDPADTWDPPAGVEECRFRTRDGLELQAWWHPGAGEAPAAGRPVVLWCHGNAGNITHRAQSVMALAERGLGVLIFDYRGYGRSEGSPSELGLGLDAMAAHRYLVQMRKVAPGRIVCLGRSLGAAVALHLALHQRVAGVIMESAFTSVPAVARLRLAFRPFALLMKNRFDSLKAVPRLRVPLLVAHGDRDDVIPIAHGRAIFAAAPEPKRFITIQGAGHDDTDAVGGEAYFTELASFCAECVAPRPPAGAGSARAAGG